MTTTLEIINQKVRISTFIIIGFCFSCASNITYSKSNYLKDFKDFVNEIEDNNQYIKDKDWKLRDEKFLKYSEEFYVKFENELSEEDQKLIGKYKAQYIKARAKYELLILGKQIKNGIDQLQGALEEVLREDSVKKIEMKP